MKAGHLRHMLFSHAQFYAAHPPSLSSEKYFSIIGLNYNEEIYIARILTLDIDTCHKQNDDSQNFSE